MTPPTLNSQLSACRFAFRGRSVTLYKRSAAKDAPWYLTFQHAGQIHKNQSLQTATLDGPAGAKARARAMIESAETGRLLEFLAALRGETPSARPQTPDPTPLREVIRAFRQLPKAREGYEVAAKAVIRRSRPKLADWQDLPLAALDADFVAAYRTAAHAHAEEADDDEAGESRLRSAHNYLVNFRAIFSPSRREEYRRRFQLDLPAGLDGFLHSPNVEAPAKTYTIPEDAIIARTFLALPGLAETDPNAHTAIWLALGAGMRKSEIADCAVDWFITLAGLRHVRLKMRTKNGSRDVDIVLTNGCEPHVDAAILRARQRHVDLSAPAYLLEGDATERHDLTFRRISQWMAELGWDTQKRAHEFRAYGGCQVAMRDGLLTARDWCRHASQATTEKHYGRYIRTRVTVAPIQIHEQPANILPLPQAAPAPAPAYASDSAATAGA